MADLSDVVQRVFNVSRVYREVAGLLLNQAQVLRAGGWLTDAEFESLHVACRHILARASDMLVTIDDALAQQLDAPLATVEKATQDLKAAESKIATASKILQVAVAVAGAAAAIAMVIAAPTFAGATAAAIAIGGAVSAAAS